MAIFLEHNVLNTSSPVIRRSRCEWTALHTAVIEPPFRSTRRSRRHASNTCEYRPGVRSPSCDTHLRIQMRIREGSIPPHETSAMGAAHGADTADSRTMKSGSFIGRLRSHRPHHPAATDRFRARNAAQAGTVTIVGLAGKVSLLAPRQVRLPQSRCSAHCPRARKVSCRSWAPPRSAAHSAP